MLGKGLESLIPQQGNSGSSPAKRDQDRPAPKDLPSGVSDDVRDLPAAPSFADLPASAAPEPELPVGDPVSANGTTGAAAARDTGPATGASATDPPSSHPVVFSQARPSPQGDRSSAAAKDAHDPQDYVFHIEVEKIRPNPGQPRREFNEDAIREMANSIREFGILQPIVVSRVEQETQAGIDVSYQLIAGERRLRAAKLLGLRVVPAIIRNVDLEREKLELAVIENLQREDLNAIEMARAFQRLQEEFRMTQREIAAKLGKSRETVANTVRLLDLPEYIQDALQKGNLSESHARLLLAVGDPAAQKQLFDDIATNGLTTRDVKERVKRVSGGGFGHRGRPSLAETEANLPPEMRALQTELSSSLGAPVQIQKGVANGKITITFYSQEELENILRKLGANRE
jgi:ParB family chromosome partitioning protein